MDIQELTPDTILPLAELMKELWPDVNMEEEVSNNSRVYRDPLQTAFLMKQDDQWVGFAYMAMRKDFVEGTSTTPVAYLEGIYIREPFRQMGYAQKLLHHCEEWSRTHGATEMGSDTDIINAVSQQFHLATGFKEVNRIVCFAKKLK
ncbi:MAG: GNAT family N-acetyltransferase [Saprospiraceae bacterium]|nr:GNAT family N-acetyltransferase [Saprospiraceae bacterium]